MKHVWLTSVVACLLASVAVAQAPRGGFGGLGGQGGAMLLSLPEVQKELGLNDDQKKQADDLVAKTRESLRGSFNFQELRNLKEDERRAKLDEARKAREAAGEKTMAEVGKILDAKQLERFHELQLQRAGIAAIAGANVAGKLGLSQEQKDKVAKLVADVRPGGPGGGNFGQLSDEERRAAFQKFRETREKLETELQNVLTTDQKSTWEKLQGKKFEFPRLGPGGRRPDAT